jgi:cell division protein FtsQ
MIARVEMSDRGAWVVELTGGTTLVVGREELDQRLSRFTRAFDHFLKESWEKVDSIDLRYTNGFAVREKAVGVDNG